MTTRLLTRFVFCGLLLISQTASAQQHSTTGDRAERLRQADIASLKADNDVYRLPWDTIMERDVLWKKRVWRDIDVAKEVNAPFAPGENSLAAILLRGALDGTITAYEGKDGRFIKRADDNELKQLSASGAGKDIFNVKKYQIKEDWLYIEGKNTLVVRIVGMAPIVTITGSNGVESDQALFWIFYPDAREYISRFKATPAENWDQLFERRSFGSNIMKSAELTRPSVPGHSR